MVTRKVSPERYDKLARIRLSKNFILRDFLFSTTAAATGSSNFPEDPTAVVAAGKELCAKVLEPVLSQFGRFAITFGYQSLDSMRTELGPCSPTLRRETSSPHCWDKKGLWGDHVYSRVDILPFCVEDGEVTKHEFGHWLMHRLDIDLVMQWTRSNVACITISPVPRRVWLMWGRASHGEPRRTVHMGSEYWTNVYPTLPAHMRPRFGPSATDGSINWAGSHLRLTDKTPPLLQSIARTQLG